MTRRASRTGLVALGVAALVSVSVSGCDTGSAPQSEQVVTTTAGDAGAAPATVPQSARSLEHVYTSKPYRYSLSFPDSWTVTTATRTWRGQGVPGRKVSDVFRSPLGQAVSVRSQQIPSRLSDEAWTDRLLAGLGTSGEPPCPVQRQGWLPIVVDGHRGGQVGGDFGCQFTTVVLVVDHRGYVFEAQPVPGHYTDQIFPQRLLDHLLASVQLHPEADA